MPRREDPILVRGQGRYTDDVSLDGQAYAAIVRSPHAHGVIRSIDIGPARGMPGVLAVYTGADLAGYGTLRCRSPLKNRDGSDMVKLERPALAPDKVRFVGDPVACVIAETAAQAKDAAEAVVLDIEPLPAVTEASAAARPGAPLLYDDVPGNLVLDYHFGDTDKVREAFAARRACHPPRAPQQSPDRQSDGAARGAGELRRGERTLHPARSRPGRRSACTGRSHRC